MPELKEIEQKPKYLTLERLLKKNIELNEKIYESCKKTEKYIFHIKIFGILKFLIVIIPIVFGVIYLIPFLKDFIGMYKDFFTNTGGATGILESIKGLKDLQVP